MQTPCFNCIAPSIAPSNGPNPAAAYFRTLRDIESYLLWDYPGWCEMQNRRKASWRAVSLSQPIHASVWCPNKIKPAVQTNRQTSREPMFSAQSNWPMTTGPLLPEIIREFMQMESIQTMTRSRLLSKPFENYFHNSTGANFFCAFRDAKAQGLVIERGEIIQIPN